MTARHPNDSLHLIFRVPFVPRSKKNNMVPIRAGGRRFIGPSQALRSEERAIAQIAQAAIAAAGLPPVPFGQREVLMVINRDVLAEELTVEVWDLGDPPKGRTGRDHDTQNLGEVICDALNGVAWDDDRQIRDYVVRRQIK